MEATEALKELNGMIKSFKALQSAEKVLRILSNEEQYKLKLAEGVKILEVKLDTLTSNEAHLETIIAKKKEDIDAKTDLINNTETYYLAKKKEITDLLKRDEDQMKSKLNKRLDELNLEIQNREMDNEILRKENIVLVNELHKLKDQIKELKDNTLKIIGAA